MTETGAAERRLDSITEVMSQLGTETRLDRVLALLTDLTRALVHCDRVSFWFWDKPAGRLWTLAASQSKRLTLPDRGGLVAETVRSGQVQRIDDVYRDPRFNPAVDRQTGYRTRSLLTIPLLNSRGEVIGAYQCVNRLAESGTPIPFTEADVRLLSVVTAFAGKSLESYTWQELDSELEVAAEIQRDILPELAPFRADGRCSLDAMIRPSRGMGGDFFDAYHLEDGRLAVTVADVSGKGIGAALTMMNAKAVLKERALNRGGSPGDVLAYANSRLSEENSTGMFVTAWLGYLDPADGCLEYASAGHEDALLLRGIRLLTVAPPQRRPALGLVPELSYPVGRLRMEPGDTLLQYTDGATDIFNVRDEQYGLERLGQTFRRLARQRVEDLPLRIMTALLAFAGTRPQYDDIGLLVLQYLGQADSGKENRA